MKNFMDTLGLFIGATAGVYLFWGIFQIDNWRERGEFGTFFTPVLILFMVALLVYHLYLIAQDQRRAEKRHQEQIRELRDRQEHEVLFRLIDDYSREELSKSSAKFWDKYRDNAKEVDRHFVEWCRGGRGQGKGKGKTVYRDVLYFWKKVALACKMGYVDKNALFAAFPDMEIAGVLIAIDDCICKDSYPSQSPDRALKELFRQYLRNKSGQDPVFVLKRNSEVSSEKKPALRLNGESLTIRSDSDLAILVEHGSLSEVTELNLGHRNISDVGLKYLKRLKQLSRLNLANTQISDAGLKHIKHLDKLISLNLANTQISDAGIEYIKDLDSLSELSLSYTKISDAGLKLLKGLSDLTELNLVKTSIKDAGLEHLKGLDKLSVLDLRWTEIGDEGLKHLKELKSLSRLDAWHSKITDRGLEHLKDFPSLSVFYAWHSKVSSEGLARLREELPSCKIDA